MKGIAIVVCYVTGALGSHGARLRGSSARIVPALTVPRAPRRTQGTSDTSRLVPSRATSATDSRPTAPRIVSVPTPIAAESLSGIKPVCPIPTTIRSDRNRSGFSHAKNGAAPTLADTWPNHASDESRILPRCPAFNSIAAPGSVHATYTPAPRSSSVSRPPSGPPRRHRARYTAVRDVTHLPASGASKKKRSIGTNSASASTIPARRSASH